MSKYRKKSAHVLGAPAVWQKVSVPVLAALYFLLVCLTSSSTVKPAVLLLLALAVGAAAVFFRRLRERLHLPILVLALVVLMDGLSTFYARSGKFALYEFLKPLAAFCLALLLLTMRDREDQCAGRRGAAILSGFSALAGLVSIDLLSTRIISAPVLGLLGLFTPDYANLSAVEEGVRMTSLFTNPNVFAGCVGLGTLLSLGLVVSTTGRERIVHLVCLYINALSFLLAFSMGASGMIALAFLVYLLLERPERRAQLLLLMVETLILSVAAAFLISLTSFTAWTGFRPVPLLCVVAGAALLCLLDRLCRPLADKLSGHSRMALVLTGVILAAVALFALAAYNLTGGASLQPGQSLRRAAYPEPGDYALETEAEGDVSVFIESQNQQETMMHTSTPLYQGPLAGASFSVPEDSLVVYFNFTANSEARLESAACAGGAGSCDVPLGYKLLPGFIANRLQGLWANQNAIQRFVFFSDGMKLFGRSPVIGLGLGAFENGVKSVQSFYYETKYAHNHYIQVLVETGAVGFVLFIGLLASSGAAVWFARKRENPLIPALGAALVFMAGHAVTEVTFSTYAYLPIAFGVIALINLCCGDAIPLPELGGMAKNGVLAAIPALLIVFGIMLSGNMSAQRLASHASSFSDLDRAVSMDRFEWADYMLGYVNSTLTVEADETIRQQADVYAARLAQVDSNTVPIYLAEYYFSTGRTELGLEMVEKYVDYVSSDQNAWQTAFSLLEGYETDAEVFRAGVVRIAGLLEDWNARNMGGVALTEANLAFIARMGG